MTFASWLLASFDLDFVLEIKRYFTESIKKMTFRKI